MAKFYIQSGGLRMIVQADTMQGAALWALHRCMCRTMPFLSDDPAPVDSDTVDSDTVARLGETIRVSEIGFDRNDARYHLTLDVLTQWNQLMAALTRIEDQLLNEVSDPQVEKLDAVVRRGSSDDESRISG